MTELIQIRSDFFDNAKVPQIAAKVPQIAYSECFKDFFSCGKLEKYQLLEEFVWVGQITEKCVKRP